jgi:hypothetical protein
VTYSTQWCLPSLQHRPTISNERPKAITNSDNNRIKPPGCRLSVFMIVSLRFANRKATKGLISSTEILAVIILHAWEIANRDFSKPSSENSAVSSVT